MAAEDKLVARKTVVAFVDVSGGLWFVPSELFVFVAAGSGLKLSNPSGIENVMLPVAVACGMLTVELVVIDVEGVLMFGVLIMFEAPVIVMGELDMPGMFITTGIALITTGVGFAMDPIPGIPDAMDSRVRPSSVSTEIDAIRGRLRAIVLCRFCSSRSLIGLILCE